MHLFDASRFRTEGLPAFRQLLADGDVPSWLQPVLDKHILKLVPEVADELWAAAGTMLLRDCTYLDDDLAPLTPSALADEAWATRRRDLETGSDVSHDDALFHMDRRCPSTDCPSRSTCPYHRSSPSDSLISVFEALFWCYLGPGQFAGRNITVEL